MMIKLLLIWHTLYLYCYYTINKKPKSKPFYNMPSFENLLLVPHSKYFYTITLPFGVR